MILKIINRPWNVLKKNPELRETFQSNLFVAFKTNENLQQIIGGHMIKNGKVFKTHLENRKRKCELCNTNHCYATSRSLTLVHYEVTKQQLYTRFFSETRLLIDIGNENLKNVKDNSK